MDISSAMFWLFICFILVCHLLKDLTFVQCVVLGAALNVAYQLLDAIGVHISINVA